MGNWIEFFRGETGFTAGPFEAQDTPSTINFDSKDGRTTPGTASPTTLLHIDAYESTKMALPLTIKFKRVHPDAKVPTRKFQLDAGLDLYALEKIYIAAWHQIIVRTGIALAGAPDSCVIQIWSKSGLDARLGLHVGAGIVDPNYRGEILVLLKNMSDHSIGINKGDAIAQLVIVPCIRPDVEIVDEIQETDRGNTGGINDHNTRG